MSDELRKAAQDVLDAWDGKTCEGYVGLPLEGLRAVLAAAPDSDDARDADRYRYLRDHTAITDAGIDAAMQQEQNNGA